MNRDVSLVVHIEDILGELEPYHLPIFVIGRHFHKKSSAAIFHGKHWVAIIHVEKVSWQSPYD